MSFIVEACKNLKSNAGVSVKDDDIDQITWFNILEEDIPSKVEIQNEVDRLNKEFASKQYQRDRASTYPELKEQLDLLWHAIDDGKFNVKSKETDFYKKLKSVKDANPKP